MIFSSRSYAIGMAHHQMAGGFRTIGFVLGAYLLLVGAVLGLIFYNVPQSDLSDAIRGIFTFLFVIQGFLLVVVGALRIAGCIRIDLMTNMMESHRQMPLHASRAVLGYLFGTTSHVVALVLLNVLVMGALAPEADITFDNFVVSQMVLALFAIFSWTFAALGTFMFRQALPLVMLGLIFGSFSSMFLRQWGILPGVSILASPFLGETIFNLSAGRFNMRAAYPTAFAAQLAFSAIFFLAACRRYRDAHAIAFNVPLGVALVAVWGLLSAIGIRIWPDEVKGRFMRGFEQPPLYGQIVAGLGVAALLMMVPLFSLAALESRWRFKAALRIAALSLIVFAGVLSVGGADLDPARYGLTLLVLACHAVTLYALFRLVRRKAPVLAGGMVLLFLFMLWIAPLIVEFVRTEFFQPPEASHDLSFITTLSPVGLLITGWNPADGQPSPLAGIVLQVVLAAGLCRLAFRRPVAGKDSPPHGDAPVLITLPPQSAPSEPPLPPV